MWVGNRGILVLLCSLLTAGASFAQEAGTAARLGMGARPLALGGAFVAIPGDATAVFRNPAALTTVASTHVQLHYRRITASHALDSGNVVFGPPRHGMVWGLSLNVLHRAGIEADDALSGFSGEPGAGEFSGQVTMAFRAHPSLSLGISAGPIVSTLDPQAGRSVGWGGNAGLLWRQAGTSIGFGVLGVTAGLGTTTAPQAYRYRVSTGISQHVGEPLLLSMQLDRQRGADPRLLSGLEWAVGPVLRLRAGMQLPFSKTDSIQVFSNGLGVQSGRFQMDYAVRFASEFSPEHLLTLRFQLGDAAEPLVQGSELSAPRATPPSQSTPPLSVADPSKIAARSAEPAAAAVHRPSVSLEEEAPQHQRITLPVVAHDGLPAPRPGAPSVNSIPEVGRVHYVVRAGVHSDMDEAALEIARFYRAQIRPNLEKRGSLYIVVVKRCDKLQEAQVWQARVRDAGLRCTIDEE